MAFGGIETVTKARGAPPASGRDVSGIVNALLGVMERQRESGEFGGIPLPRDPRWDLDTFGPGFPLRAEALDPVRPDTGQPDPRLHEYPVSWNLRLGKDRHVSWETLKDASETPLFRACIELRKTEISSLDWAIRVSPDAAASIARKQKRYEEDVADELRGQYEDDIDRATAFWEVPDRKNGRNFAEWIGLCMEEQLTWDALAVYPRMTYGGDLLDLWVIDGSTILPLLDETGGRPEQPYPAYQQILYGFPRGEYTAVTVDRDGKQVVPGGLLANQLIYRRRVPRTRSPYGYSPTEQALLSGLLYNKRFQWMIGEYTEGSLPAQFMKNDGQSDWTPRQLLEYEREFNDTYAGQTAQRLRFPFLPPGLEPAQMTPVPERYRSEYDLWLTKLVAMHFMTTVSELGFNEAGGLGSTGFHEGMEDINFRKARLPDLRWFADFCTEISHTYLHLAPELEFTFLGLDQEDEAAADLLDQNRLVSARMTLNECRAKLGLPPYDFAEADMPMMQTARGVVFLKDASKTAPAGVLIEPASEQEGADEGGKSGATSPTQRRPIKSGGGSSQAAKALSEGNAALEVLAYRRWVGRHPDSPRPFNFEHLTPELAKQLGVSDLLDSPMAVFKAGGAAPKELDPYLARVRQLSS
jgi:hypothetical protein